MDEWEQGEIPERGEKAGKKRAEQKRREEEIAAGWSSEGEGRTEGRSGKNETRGGETEGSSRKGLRAEGSREGLRKKKKMLMAIPAATTTATV